MMETAAEAHYQGYTGGRVKDVAIFAISHSRPALLAVPGAESKYQNCAVAHLGCYK